MRVSAERFKVHSSAGLFGRVEREVVYAADYDSLATETSRVRARLDDAEALIQNIQQSVMRLNKHVSTFGIAGSILRDIESFRERKP